MFRFIVTLSILSVTNGQSCRTARKETGDCIKITECDSMFKVLQNTPISQANVIYLRNSQCGIARRIPKVCCPFNFENNEDVNTKNNDVGMTPKDVLLQMTNISQAPQEVTSRKSEVITLDDLLIKMATATPNENPILQDVEPCRTEFNEPGQCVIIIQCNPLFKILQNKPISPRNVRYLIKSQCGFEDRIPKVCCPSDLEKMPEMDVNNDMGIMPDDVLMHMCEKQRKGIEPEGRGNLCGIPKIYGRIHGGNNTYPGEFPWSALLVYRIKSNEAKFICGGVLISRRYVLTAAHCITNNLVSVRLGEYDTEHQGEDCVEIKGQNICAGPSIDVPIQQIIIHSNFNPVNLHNDIALIKLNTKIEYNDYIQRICLPTTIRDLAGNFATTQFMVVGWGSTEDKIQSPIQLKLKVAEYEFGKCSKTYNSLRTRLTSFMNSTDVTLTNGQFCAGGQRGKDACGGDSGGPLMGLSMRSGGPRWVLAGLVSLASPVCGTEDVPGVYTKVWNYSFWMKQKLSWLIVPNLSEN